MNHKIKLIALDLDGTLYNTKSQISERNREALKYAVDCGITVVISTGRPYVGLPLSPMDGAALLQQLYKYPIHLDAFIDGDAYTQRSTRGLIERLQISESLRTYIRDTRIVVDDLAGYVSSNQLGIQKLTLNFTADANGKLTAREDVIALLQADSKYHYDIVTLAGIGVAMSNSEKILLDAADFVSLSNDEDGVAYAIEELILSNP